MHKSFEKINETTYVCDDGHVRFFLLIGDDEALLIDSGMETVNAKELARKYKQETFYAQFPGQAPNHYNQDGKVVNKNSSKDFKFNREGETYFTTTKLSKNPEVPRFTADISSVYDDDGNLLQVTEAKLYFYEHWVKSGVGQISERMHREWKGECVL